MSAMDLVDPELRELAAGFPPLALSAENLIRTRAAMAAAMRPLQRESSGDGLTVETITVPGAHGAPPVGLIVYRPPAVERPGPALLHIHGGGFVLGSAAGSDGSNRLLARELGCVVVSVDYRLAPETPYPGALQDCYAALAWLHEAADRLGVDRGRIGIRGESAGGGLAAAVALMARDRGDYPLAFQHLIYPMLDDRTCVAEHPHPHTGHFVWTAQDNCFGWAALLGHEPGRPDTPAYAAPARATNLAELPSTFIAVGNLDLFLDEDIVYAQRLARAGVPIELRVYPGAFHGFQLAPRAGVTRMAERDSLAALRRACTTMQPKC